MMNDKHGLPASDDEPPAALPRVAEDPLDYGANYVGLFTSKTSRPLLGVDDFEDLRRPQGPHSGINAVIGAWPGDETDEVVFRILDEMS